MQNVRVMLYENEVIMFLLGAGIFVFIILNRAHVRRIKAWKILFASYCFLLTSWLLTILEGFLLESWFNFLEHLGYAFSAAVFAVWIWKSFHKSRLEDKL